MTHATKAVHKNDKLFHDRLENTTEVLLKQFSDLQALRTRINRHDKNLDILDKNMQNILTPANYKFYKTTVTLNNHHLAIEVHSIHLISQKIQGNL